MTRLESPLVEAGEAAGERVLEVAAGEVLLEQADQEEAEQPDGSVAENVAAKEQATVDHQESRFPEGQDKERKAADAPSQAREEVPHFAAVAKAVDGVGAALDLRHDPGYEENYEELDRLADEHEAWRAHCVRDGLRGLWNIGEKLVPDTV